LARRPQLGVLPFPSTAREENINMRITNFGLACILAAVVANASPARADEPYNGCGEANDPIPNDPGGYDFTEACNWHDMCYGGTITGYSQYQCDWTFHQYMDTICYYNYGNSTGCRFWSSAYYGGVSLFGQYHWYYAAFFYYINVLLLEPPVN
jgi:hypothetical protein